MTTATMTERQIALVNAAGWVLGARRAARRALYNWKSAAHERHCEEHLGWVMAVVNLLQACRYAS